jgi:hypothetical protein
MTYLVVTTTLCGEYWNTRLKVMMINYSVVFPNRVQLFLNTQTVTLSHFTYSQNVKYTFNLAEEIFN